MKILHSLVALDYQGRGGRSRWTSSSPKPGPKPTNSALEYTSWVERIGLELVTLKCKVPLLLIEQPLSAGCLC